MGADAVLSHSSALQELEKRKGSTDILLDKLQQLMQDSDNYESIAISESLMIILLHNDILQKELTNEEKEFLRQNIFEPYR